VLVPTTILAEQHYKTFEKRFTKFGYNVDVLSRFKTKKQQKETLEKLRQHKVDVIIGTHRLLQKDVKFADLGMLIVDEEQRFGVSHKERIKQMKELVDVISVSATPIPRTLYMALSGAKDLSVIETPPKQKKPVVTHISEWSEEKVKQAVKTELKRKGQVFYIYNRVQNIHRKAEQLRKLFPNVSIEFAHGQMKEKELQDIMMRFFDKKIKILVCTTIIENGLDITSANTIILEEANRFGLSQIHQLRGRVGRTDIQGHCYLFFTSANTLTDKAQQRLQAIREYAALGSGYKLAMKDLEIRGAGELIGTQQSGQVSQVGFELYCKMLEDAVKLVKGEAIEDDAVLPLDISKISVPEEIIEDPRERFALYTRLYQLSSKEECDALHQEICDRYGRHTWKFDNVFRYVKDVLSSLQ
jgi:transcription-repair coupling factor (superfamily II helicase)